MFDLVSRRWIAAFFAVAALALVGVGFSQPAHADPAITGYPNSFASLGDSISRGYDADATRPGNPQEQLDNAWSTGTSTTVNTIYNRLLAVHPAVLGNNFNDAVSGAKMIDLNGQAVNAVAQNPEMVLILMGGNDLCTTSEATMTPVATIQAQFQQAMQTLTTGLPNARIGVISIPDVFQLWNILHTDPTANFVWNFASICQSLLANPNSFAAADVQRRANVRQRNIDDNVAIHDTCAQYAHCRHDNYLGFNTAFTTADVSSFDYFHPSVAGQAKIADGAWTNGWDFTEVNPPVSKSGAGVVSGGVLLVLSATDDVGVQGIEYKVGAGGYQTWLSPANIPTGSTLVWRAVDVNGNTEATHTCHVGGWDWAPSDTDCDGFADSAPAAARTSEAFVGTLPGQECAANPGPNNEPLPDAWPVDFNDDQLAGGQDILALAPVFNTHTPGPPYAVRFDLNGDGIVGGQDILKFAPFFNKRCA